VCPRFSEIPRTPQAHDQHKRESEGTYVPINRGTRVQGFLDTKGTITIVSTSTVVKGDLALTHSHWRLDVPAGEPMEHTSAEVAVASRTGPGSTPSTIPMGQSPRLIASALPHARAIDEEGSSAIVKQRI
jgi:hypothetical protein